jgi:hypothetical protein
VKTILRRLAVTAAAVVLTAGLVASASPAHAALPPNIRCAVAKRKSAVKGLRAVNACFAKPATPGAPFPDPACLARADQTMQQEFARAEAGGGCLPVTGDEPIAERVVDQCETNLVRSLPGMCIASGSPCSNIAPCCNRFCIGELGQDPVCE